MKYSSRLGKPCAKIAILEKLNSLSWKQLSASELTKLPYSKFTISEAITKLEHAGIVERERIGKLIIVKLKP